MERKEVAFFMCAFYSAVGNGDCAVCLRNPHWCNDFERMLRMQGYCTTDGHFERAMAELMADWCDE